MSITIALYVRYMHACMYVCLYVCMYVYFRRYLFLIRSIMKSSAPRIILSTARTSPISNVQCKQTLLTIGDFEKQWPHNMRHTHNRRQHHHVNYTYLCMFCKYLTYTKSHNPCYSVHSQYHIVHCLCNVRSRAHSSSRKFPRCSLKNN